MYDYTKASDLVKWANEQYKLKNRYKNGGIGRYDADGTRQFDCSGFFKCFLWHDYSSKNAKYYGKVQKDLNCEGLYKEAKEKGDISKIPEIPGILVYQKGHMGIYLGDGKVIESTAKKYNNKSGKIYITYFKGNCKNTDGKRTTWTNWFKSPYLTYDVDSFNSFLKGKEYFKLGDSNENINKIARYLYEHSYESKSILGNTYSSNLFDAVKRFQTRAKEDGKYSLNSDGNQKSYRIILDIEDTNNDVNYVVYTDESENSDGSVNAYACSYILSEKGNILVLGGYFN